MVKLITFGPRIIVSDKTYKLNTRPSFERWENTNQYIIADDNILEGN